MIKRKAIANRTFVSLDDLEEVTVERCHVLFNQKERVRGLTSYH